VSLRKAYQEMVKVQGIADTATLMEMSENAVDNRIYERHGQEFKVRQCLRLQQISGTTKFAEEIAEMSGGMFVPLPEFAECKDDLLNQFMRLHTELGQMASTYQKAVADGQIDDKEKAELTAIKQDLLMDTQALFSLMFRIHCKEAA
jgi:secreted Zn-dependent insulinase-like peptidase